MATIYFNNSSLFVKEDYETVYSRIDHAIDFKMNFIELVYIQKFYDESNLLLHQVEKNILVNIDKIIYVEN